jgi:hypothetical protein
MLLQITLFILSILFTGLPCLVYWCWFPVLLYVSFRFAFDTHLFCFVLLVVSSCHVSLHCLCGLPWVFYSLGEPWFFLGSYVRSLYGMFSCKSINCPHRSLSDAWYILYLVLLYIIILWPSLVWNFYRQEEISPCTYSLEIFLSVNTICFICVFYIRVTVKFVCGSVPLYASRQICTRLNAYSNFLAPIVALESLGWIILLLINFLLIVEWT